MKCLQPQLSGRIGWQLWIVGKYDVNGPENQINLLKYADILAAVISRVSFDVF